MHKLGTIACTYYAHHMHILVLIVLIKASLGSRVVPTAAPPPPAARDSQSSVGMTTAVSYGTALNVTRFARAWDGRAYSYAEDNHYCVMLDYIARNFRCGSYFLVLQCKAAAAQPYVLLS